MVLLGLSDFYAWLQSDRYLLVCYSLVYFFLMLYEHIISVVHFLSIVQQIKYIEIPKPDFE